jgi:hypothetical protein
MLVDWILDPVTVPRSSARCRGRPLLPQRSQVGLDLRRAQRSAPSHAGSRTLPQGTLVAAPCEGTAYLWV